MGLYTAYKQAMADNDVTAYLSLLHDDFTVVFHKSGNSFSKEEWAEMVSSMMANEKFIQEFTRCVYENDDILVEHSFMSYPDDTREAVMMIALKKDGKIIRVETGATTLDL
ncbi:MAG: nuclear transport factor 2 family protein [Candidatus Puniceispirillaceae bacterium]